MSFIVKYLKCSRILRSVIYTAGHIVIATVCNVYITGAAIKLAVTDALVEPILNGVWYYVLDTVWCKYMSRNKN